jgi:hypothetical protein
MMVLGCSGGIGSGGSSTQAPATVSIHVWDDGDFPYPTGGDCVRTISWSFTPITLTGSGGRSTAVTMQNQQYKSKVQTGDCFYTEKVDDLRAGEWTIGANGADGAYASWSTSCVVQLNPDDNDIYITMGMEGCSKTRHITP